MNKVYFLLLSIVFIIPTFSSAQRLKAYEKAAHDEYTSENYVTAMNHYAVVVDGDENASVENLYHAGVSAYKVKVFQIAERHFQRLASMEGRTEYPNVEYLLGITKKRLGKYTEAIGYLEKFKAKCTDAEDIAKANKEIESCEFASAQMDTYNNSAYKIAVDHLDDNVNTCYADFAPVHLDNTLYYTSFPRDVETCDRPDALTRLFTSSGGQMSENMPKTLNKDGKHASQLSFDDSGSKVYFTLCEPTTDRKKVLCEIFSSERDANGYWSDPAKLPESINMPNYTATNPAAGKDENGNDVLYFVSDRPTGVGQESQLDIYMASLGDYSGGVKNLSELNTDGNDVTPFYDYSANTLYFSSDGRKNMGGYDIYKTRRTNSGWGTAKHISYPISSGYDDLYFTVSNGEKGEAYFSSNRPGFEVCDDFKSDIYSCEPCNDIYKAQLPKVDLKVITKNSITGELLNDANVVMKEISSNSEGEAINAGAGNNYEYILEFEEGYELFASKEGYTSDENNAETFNMFVDTSLVRELLLTPLVNLEAFTFEKSTGSPLDGCKVELFKMNARTLDQSQLEDASIMYGYPLEWKYDYLVVATKPGYTSDSVRITTNDIAVIPTMLREKLYLGLTAPPVISCNCADLTHPVFTIPDGPAPKTTTVLGRAPEYGDSHALDALGFYTKLNGKYESSRKERKFLDDIFKQMGYTNGWADATPDVFSEVTLPRGLSGNLGTKTYHATVYRTLDPYNARDLEAFKIKARNGCDLHFMKTCGNHFFFKECVSSY